MNEENNVERLFPGKKIDNIIEALVKAQLEISAPVKDKINPRFKTSYCSLDSIYSACRLPLARNGITLSHSVEQEEGKTTLVTTLSHISGEQMSNRIPMFIDAQTSQGFASALTYARRYAVCSLIGLPTDDDDDGEVATQEQVNGITMTPSHQQEISKVLGEDMALRSRVLQGYNVENFSQIPDKEFGPIIAKLKKIKESQ